MAWSSASRRWSCCCRPPPPSSASGTTAASTGLPTTCWEWPSGAGAGVATCVKCAYLPTRSEGASLWVAFQLSACGCRCALPACNSAGPLPASCLCCSALMPCLPTPCCPRPQPARHRAPVPGRSAERRHPALWPLLLWCALGRMRGFLRLCCCSMCGCRLLCCRVRVRASVLLHVWLLAAMALGWAARRLLNPASATPPPPPAPAPADIFWVFATPVMVSVAKNFEAPIKLLFPRPWDAPGAWCGGSLRTGAAAVGLLYFVVTVLGWAGPLDCSAA